MQDISVYHIDDQAAFIAAFSEAVASSGAPIKLIGHAGSGKQGLDFLRQQQRSRVDIVLIDLEMPVSGGDGFDCLKVIHQEFPKMRVVLLTTHNSFALATTAINKGASGYLLKTTSIEKITGYLQGIFSGQIIVDHNIKVVPPSPDFITLEEEEQEIVCLIMDEYTSLEIAAEMKKRHKGDPRYNVVYIDNTRSRIIEKIHCTKVVGVAKYALKSGLYPLQRGTKKIPANMSMTGQTSQDSALGKANSIYILDDHVVFAQGLAHVISNYRKYAFRLVGYGSNKEAFFTGTEDKTIETPNILLLDYTLPGENITDLIQNIKQQFEHIKIVVVLSDFHQAISDTCIKAGAVDVVHKNMDISDIMQIIMKQVNGAVTPLPPPVLEHTTKFDAFDLKIIQLILEEKDSRGIALEMYQEKISKLHGSERTTEIKRATNRIDARRANILAKIGGKNVISIVRYAWENYMF